MTCCHAVTAARLPAGSYSIHGYPGSAGKSLSSSIITVTYNLLDAACSAGHQIPAALQLPVFLQACHCCQQQAPHVAPLLLLEDSRGWLQQPASGMPDVLWQPFVRPL